MPTSNPTGSGPERAPKAVSIDAELANRLVGALEMIGSAFKLDEVNDARTLGLAGRLRRDGRGRRFVEPDEARERAARDYDILRGLLGRAGAPRPLRMERTGGGASQDNSVIIIDPVPIRAVTARVESPGDGTSGVVVEEFPTIPRPTHPETRTILVLRRVLATMPIARVELLDGETLVAFGRSHPALPFNPLG